MCIIQPECVALNDRGEAQMEEVHWRKKGKRHMKRVRQ